MPYTPDPNDVTQPQGNVDASTAATEFRALKTKIAAMISGLFTTTAVNTNPFGLVNLLHPSVNDFGKEIIASGWDFCGRNQQWGGSPSFYHLVDSATGVQYKFESFDGYIEDDGSLQNIGAAAANFYVYQTITPSKNLSLNEIWWKGYKSGNPVDNLTLQLYSVAAGIPNALIATANVINGKQITSDTNGQWYRFTFAAVQALVAGTQYVIVMSKSAGVDAANFYIWKTKTTTKYPNNLRGVGTVVPAWTAANTFSQVFLAVSQASDQVHQAGGQFENKLVGYDANPVNRGSALCQDLKSLKWNPKKGTVLIRGGSFTKGKPIFDALYGLHHDRLVLYADSISGVGKVSLYQQNGTVSTIVGTTDLSTITFKDISIEYSINGNGGDYLRLRVGTGAVAPTVEASLVAQTFVMDPLWGQLGTAWLMGGFDPTFTNATYSKLSDMTLLPSADGWTYTTTTATVEGTIFGLSGGKLNQIKAGYAAGGDGYYLKNAIGFGVGNGGLVTAKTRVVFGTNTKDQGAVQIQLADGNRIFAAALQEYFNYIHDNVNVSGYPQLDFKSVENTLFLMGGVGGSQNSLLYCNGKLIQDGTGKHTTVTALNQVSFGDMLTTANENADALWDYVAYYNAGPSLPRFSSCILSEFAYWQEDAAAIMTALYNAGAPLSVKAYAGVQKNYVGEGIEQRVNVRGITFNPTNLATLVLVPDMEGFCVGNSLHASFHDRFTETVAGISDAYVVVDGLQVLFSNHSTNFGAAGGTMSSYSRTHKDFNTYFGLHKVEGWASLSGGGTQTHINGLRGLSVEGRSV